MKKASKSLTYAVYILAALLIGVVSVGLYKIYANKTASAPSVSQSDSVKGAESNIDEEKETVSILLVGDIMLGRHVETLMKENGELYPFAKIESVLRNSTTVIGNLEGTIGDVHIQTPINSMKFSFPTTTAALLSKNNFSVVTLGNNHAFDYGVSAYNETKDRLVLMSVVPTGHPFSVSEEYAKVIKVGDKKIAAVSFNATNPKFPVEEAINTIQVTRMFNPDAFVAVFVHWGEEYSLTENETQRSLAHSIIDAGADVIFGTHPHVVQGIEKYKEKIIFYSLGNFIFDQYFSSDVQEGLVVKMDFSRGAPVYYLLPIASEKSQPHMMPKEKSEIWLEQLSARSAVLVREEIVSGFVTGMKNTQK